MIALTEEGHQVSFRNDNAYNNSPHSKDTVTFTTKDKDKANAWAADMVSQGYEVTITFNENTGEYTCTAVK